MKKKLFFVGAILVAGSDIYAQQEMGIQEVTIAGKTNQKVFETGKNVKLLTQKDLEKFKGQNLTDVLNTVAGFQITGNFNNQSEPKSMKIRGGKSTNVLILIDGVPLKDVTGNDYTAADLRLLALENVESIEVLNGASSVLYGSNATVSVINITMKKSAQKPVEGMVSARGGSFSTFAQDAAVRGKSGDFTYQVSGFNEKSEGISSALGDGFDKDGWEKQNVSANVGYSKDNFDVNINSGWNHHLYLYDTGAFEDGKQRGNDKQFYAGLHAGLGYNKGKVVLNVRHTSTDRLAQDFAAGGYKDQFQYKGNVLFAELFNSYEFTDFLNVVGGLQYEKQSMDFSQLPWGAASMEQVLKSEDTWNSSLDVFLKAAFHYKSFHLDAGTRMTDHSRFGSHWVYSVNPYFLGYYGDAYAKIGYAYATAFIAPTLYQSYGSLPYVLPNADLKPETNQSHEIDLSAGKKDGSINFNASFFQRSEKQVFAYMTTDMTTYAGKFFNIDSNKVKGFEIGMDYSFDKIARVGGNFTYVEKENKATMRRQPKQRITSYLEVLPAEFTRVTLSHQFTGSNEDAYYDSASGKVKSVQNAKYHLFNLNVNQKVIKNINAFLNIGNLFNKSYTDVVGYTTKPRNYTLGVNYQF